MEQKTKFKQTEIGMIPEDWEVKRLGDNIDKIFCGRDPQGGKQSHSAEKTKYAIIQSAPVFDGFLDREKIGYIPKETYDDFKSASLIEEDVLLNQLGDGITFARSCVVPNEVLPAIITRSVGCIRCNKKKLNPWFLNAFLILPKTKEYIESFNSGSSRRAIDGAKMKSFLIPIPSLNEQKKIGYYYETIQNKIELNQQMNKNLEAIGLALFNKWFNIDDIPENWENKPLDEIAEYLNGLPLQKYPVGDDEEYLPVIKIRELRNGISEQTEKASLDVPEDYVIENGDVLFSWSGTLEVEIWTNGKGALNQHLFKVSSKDYPKWFYYYWTKHFLRKFRHIAKGKATTMGHIQRHNLTESEVIIPDKKAFENLNKIMSPIVERLITINLESRNLERIRNLLLPKLMSGKIRVPV